VDYKFYLSREIEDIWYFFQIHTEMCIWGRDALRINLVGCWHVVCTCLYMWSYLWFLLSSENPSSTHYTHSDCVLVCIRERERERERETWISADWTVGSWFSEAKFPVQRRSRKQEPKLVEYREQVLIVNRTEKAVRLEKQWPTY